MILALVLDADELRSDTINSTIINYLLSTGIAASKSSTFKYDGFHISEPLIVLMKLCINDAIIDHILQQSQTLEFFCIILEKFLARINDKEVDDENIDLDILTVMALADILWSISFHNRYKNDLIKNVDLIKTLEKFRAIGIADKVLANCFIPHHMSSLTKAIHGIWENLFPSPPSSLSSPFTPAKSVRRLVISYCHADVTFCRQLYDLLSKDSKLSIWVDCNYCDTRDLRGSLQKFLDSRLN